MALCGGFPPGGGFLAERDPAAHETILSGDLSGDDGPDLVNNDENSYHVVTASNADETVVMDGFVVTGGNADGDSAMNRLGGGFFNIFGNPTLADCIFIDNSARDAGGGMYNNFSGSPTLTNCLFKRNATRFGGGGMYNGNSSPELTSCVFIGNTAGAVGGGMYTLEGNPMLANCTFGGNVANGVGGGMYNYNLSRPTLTNCILWGNSGAGRSDESAQIDGGSPSVAYSCIQGLDTLASEGNIGVDPLLIGDGLHLQAGSPCIDSGDPFGDYDEQTDIDGEPREIGDYVDIGADEFLDTDGDALPDWWEQLHFGSPTAGDASADFDNDGRDNLAEYVGGTDPLIPLRTYYVDLAGDDEWDGLARVWDGKHGPKATIQAGIDIAHPYEGDVAIVAPGTYTGDGNRDMGFFGKAITVRSSNPTDPEVVSATVIDCEGTETSPHRAFWFRPNDGPDSVVAGFTITGGYATEGGAVKCDSASPTLTHCTFIGNSASNRGGGMYNNEFSRPTLTGCTFSGNVAEYGGGMYNSFSSPTLINCTFSGNAATISGSSGGGGGMYNESSSSPMLTNCTFDANTTNRFGGGMYNISSSSRPTLVNCTFSKNEAGVGGGMYNGNGRPMLIDCVFSENVATGFSSSGGGMYNAYASPTLDKCTFSGNMATGMGTFHSGGGMHNFDSSPTLTNCTFIRNTATGTDAFRGGGGMFNTNSSNPMLTNCKFSGNTTNSRGGGMYNFSLSSPILANCTFSGNAASSRGGGMYNAAASSPTLANCTFSGNSAEFGGGIRNGTDGSPNLTSCVLWGNADAGGMDESAQLDSGLPALAYSCIQGLDGLAGEGNIGDDPVFVRSPDAGPDEVWGTDDDDYGDLRLMVGSPAIDAGDPSVTLEPGETDFDGHARVLCGRVDMGAYEFGIGDFDCNSSVDLDDYASWADCLTGAGGRAYAAGCEAFDFDFDRDVDLIDFAGFQNGFGE